MVCIIGPHISLSMKTERYEKFGRLTSSSASIARLDNTKGNFEIKSYEFFKVEKTIIFIVRGIQKP